MHTYGTESAERLTQRSADYSHLGSFDILLSDDDDDDDLVVHTGAVSGFGLLTSEGLFRTEKPRNFSLLVSPVTRDVNSTVHSFNDSFDVKLNSHYGGQSRVVSPEKEVADDLAQFFFEQGKPLIESPKVAELIIDHLEDLYSRIETLEQTVQRLESNMHLSQSNRSWGRRGSGMSSVTYYDDDPTFDPPDQRKVGKRSLRCLFKFRFFRVKPSSKTRAEA